MILLVAASERGFLAKLHACDTWQGLRVRCCGAQMLQAANCKRDAHISAEASGMVHRSR